MLNKVIFSTLTALLMTFAVLNTSVAGPVFGGGCGGAGKCGDNLDLLTEDEADDLKYMREEEKLAHDIYVMMAEKWGLIVFENIAKSEEKHMAAVKHLLDKYNLTVPVLEFGEFTIESLQDAYDDYLVRGRESATAALQVGGEIEEIDIFDILAAIERTDKDDIISTYEHLVCGSSNHLRAFVKQLDLWGGSYDPLDLDDDELAAIVKPPIARKCGNERKSGTMKDK
jgi:hypothetical protein